jgi:hypothetical protein
VCVCVCVYVCVWIMTERPIQREMSTEHCMMTEVVILRGELTFPSQNL